MNTERESNVPPITIPTNAADAGGVSRARRSMAYDEEEEEDDEVVLARRRADDVVAVSFEGATTLERTSSSMFAPTDVLTIVRGKTSPGDTSEDGV